MSTKYLVFAGDKQVASKSKKQDAVDVALKARDDERVDVRVETDKGTVVFEQAAPKSINMSKPYTRDAGALSDDDIIDGKRVAYKRVRRGFALLDANWDPTDAGNGTYSAWDLKRHEYVEDLEPMTTREFGRWCADEGDAYRESHPALTGA